MEYNQQRQQNSSTKDVTVKENDPWNLMRFQGSVYLKCVMITGYDWEYSIEEKNCELAASFGVFKYRFSFFCFCFFLLFFHKFSFSRSFILA
jgi:hypothetical protein